MLYPKVWGAIADHSGDAYFDFVYGADWPNTLDALAKFASPKRKEGPIDVAALASASKGLAEGLDDGRVARFIAHLRRAKKLGKDDGHTVMNLCMLFDRRDGQELAANARYYLGRTYELPKLGKYGVTSKVFHVALILCALTMRMHSLDKGEVLTAVEFRVREPQSPEFHLTGRGLRGSVSPLPLEQRFPSIFIVSAQRMSAT